VGGCAGRRRASCVRAMEQQPAGSVDPAARAGQHRWRRWRRNSAVEALCENVCVSVFVEGDKADVFFLTHDSFAECQDLRHSAKKIPIFLFQNLCRVPGVRHSANN